MSLKSTFRLNKMKNENNKKKCLNSDHHTIGIVPNQFLYRLEFSFL